MRLHTHDSASLKTKNIPNLINYSMHDMNVRACKIPEVFTCVGLCVIWQAEGGGGGGS